MKFENGRKYRLFEKYTAVSNSLAQRLYHCNSNLETVFVNSDGIYQIDFYKLTRSCITGIYLENLGLVSRARFKYPKSHQYKTTSDTIFKKINTSKHICNTFTEMLEYCCRQRKCFRLYNFFLISKQGMKNEKN